MYKRMKWMLYYFICSLGMYCAVCIYDKPTVTTKLTVCLFLSVVILVFSVISAKAAQTHDALSNTLPCCIGLVYYCLSLACMLKILLKFFEGEYSPNSFFEINLWILCFLTPPIALILWIITRLAGFTRSKIRAGASEHPVPKNERQDPFGAKNHRGKVLMLGVPLVICCSCAVICRRLMLSDVDPSSLEQFRIHLSDAVLAVCFFEVYFAMVIWMSRITRAGHKYIRHSMEGDAQ